MARFVAGVALGLALGFLGTARASDPSDEVQAAAIEAGVDPVALAGAVNTTGLPPRAYLQAVGELAAPVPPLTGDVARADCIIGKESGGLDVPNRQGSGATGPGQYFASTWQAHTALYRTATGYSGPLSLHSLADVRRVMAFVLGTYPWMRAAWSVGGC